MNLNWFMWWYEYLVISPSYELARRYNEGELTAADKANLPEDFDLVLAVYEDFGDVLHTNYLNWWRERAMELCAVRGEKPEVSIFAVLKQFGLPFPDPCEKISDYMENEWANYGQQNTALIAVPLGMPKTQITRQVGLLLDQIPDWTKKLRYHEPKYSLAGDLVNLDMVTRYFLVLATRAAKHDLKLWQVGALSQISDTYSQMFDFESEVKRKTMVFERSILSTLTSRAFKRGILISENAARGVFPSYAPCPHAVKPDLVEMNSRFNSVVRGINP